MGFGHGLPKTRIEPHRLYLLTLDQQSCGVEHLSLVTVGSAGVRPSVIPRDPQDSQTTIMHLRPWLEAKNEQVSIHPFYTVQVLQAVFLVLKG